jgi:hypothetical protein
MNIRLESLQGKKALWTSSFKLEDNVKVDLTEKGRELWTDIRVQLQDFVNLL